MAYANDNFNVNVIANYFSGYFIKQIHLTMHDTVDKNAFVQTRGEYAWALIEQSLSSVIANYGYATILNLLKQAIGDMIYKNSLEGSWLQKQFGQLQLNLQNFLDFQPLLPCRNSIQNNLVSWIIEPAFSSPSANWTLFGISSYVL